MEKFLLLIREDLKKFDGKTQDYVDACTREMVDWIAELSASGNYASGEPLRMYGRYVDKNNVHTDGPFIEAKEAVSGYVMIVAENLDQASSIAQTCPRVVSGDCIVEVRPIVELTP